jgi:hypothetical protein
MCITNNNIVQIPTPWYGSVCPALTEKAAYIAALLLQREEEETWRPHLLMVSYG